jgi:hypothetical protein
MISRDEGSEGSSVSARSGNDPSGRVETHGPAAACKEKEAYGPMAAREEADSPMAAREEAYGPIGFRRYAKDDGRALILYTHRRPTDGGSANEGSARE